MAAAAEGFNRSCTNEGHTVKAASLGFMEQVHIIVGATERVPVVEAVERVPVIGAVVQVPVVEVVFGLCSQSFYHSNLGRDCMVYQSDNLGWRLEGNKRFHRWDQLKSLQTGTFG